MCRTQRYKIAKEIRIRLAMQEAIREKFGEEAIQKARDRLCANCKELNCLLLPITTDGADCPYFKPKEEQS